MRVKRTSTKEFPTETWAGDRWQKGWPAKGTLVPYRLPELIAGRDGKRAYVCEGEKDCENVAALGLVATCNPGGASTSRDPTKSKWVPELNQWFAGYDLVYVLEDNDEPGRLHAAHVLRALAPIVPEMVLVRFPELAECGDVSDWLATLNPRTAKATLLARCEQARKQQSSTGEAKLVRLSDVPLKALDWLWKLYILRDGLEVLSGLPGMGKSLVECNLIATLTTGRQWPDGSAGPVPGTVIIVTAEDGADDYRRRIEAAGGELNRVLVLESIKRSGRDEMFLLGEDIATLERTILKLGDVHLVCIDAITGFMGGARNFDSHRATDVRSQLTPLSLLAKRRRIAISAVTHPPKNSSQRALDHFIGSQAFIAAPRCGHLCIEERIEGEPSGRRLFLPAKYNHAPAMPGLAYRIEAVRIGWDKDLNEPIEPPRILWEGPVDMTADEAVAAARPVKERRSSQSAKDFLEDLLAGGPQLATFIEERGAKRGYTPDQLRYARQKLKIDPQRQGGSGHRGAGNWYWELPEGLRPAPMPSEDMAPAGGAPDGD
jgi:putative DNA primase/helicase